jgi:hypothetical protein
MWLLDDAAGGLFLGTCLIVKYVTTCQCGSQSLSGQYQLVWSTLHLPTVAPCRLASLVLCNAKTMTTLPPLHVDIEFSSVPQKDASMKHGRYSREVRVS